MILWHILFMAEELGKYNLSKSVLISGIIILLK